MHTEEQADVVSKRPLERTFGNDTGRSEQTCATECTFGNDAGRSEQTSVTKRQFGNDADVVSKRRGHAAVGNDTALFVRVRRRKLKGGHYRWRTGDRTPITASASYDVVHAVRIDGKPRHQFLFGLGSLKEGNSDHEMVLFWDHAISKMKRNKLDEERRRRLMDEMIRKGVPAPLADALDTDYWRNRCSWLPGTHEMLDELKRYIASKDAAGEASA